MRKGAQPPLDVVQVDADVEDDLLEAVLVLGAEVLDLEGTRAVDRLEHFLLPVLAADADVLGRAVLRGVLAAQVGPQIADLGLVLPLLLLGLNQLQ